LLTNSEILDFILFSAGRVWEYWELAKPVGISTALNLGRKGLPSIAGERNWKLTDNPAKSFSKRNVLSPMTAISVILLISVSLLRENLYGSLNILLQSQ
jgi:low affinity Fe/Cu permease